MKRGQVTLFIIIGILVLVAVSLTLYVNREYIKNLFEQQISKLTGIPQQIQPVNNYLENCLYDVSETGVEFIFLQGGYLNPEPYINIKGVNVAYWYNQKDVSPDIKVIEKEISKFIELYSNSCLTESETLLKDYKLKEKSKAKVTTFIIENKIIINIDYPIEIGYNEIFYNINKFNVELTNNFNILYQESREILKEEVKNPNYVNTNLLQGLNSSLDIINMNENLIVYSLNNNDYTLMFANKF